MPSFKLIIRPACLLSALVFLAAGADAQTRGREDSAPLAVVDGKPIHESDLLPLIAGQLRQLRAQEYEIKSEALEYFIIQKLLEEEARRRNTTPEKLLEQEAAANAKEPTDAEVEAYYRSQGMDGPLEQVREQLRGSLKEERLRQARSAYLNGLRERAAISILLRPERVEVAPDPGRLTGGKDAPVTIVEFSDFQCPFCQRAQATLKQLLAKYKGRVRLSFRDFPLNSIHPQAQPAAEASRCAAEQGKFWEYHDLLFANYSKLDAKLFPELARQLRLNEAQFKTCLATGKYRAAVESDVQQGTRAGVAATPTFFVNGVPVSGAKPAAEFEKLIDAELQILRQPPPDPPAEPKPAPPPTRAKAGKRRRP